MAKRPILYRIRVTHYGSPSNQVVDHLSSSCGLDTLCGKHIKFGEATEQKRLKAFLFADTGTCIKCGNKALKILCKVIVKPEFTKGMAYTLNAEEVCEGHTNETGEHTRKHKDGWTIKGIITEDAYYWVTDFLAYHDVHGIVWGDFEGTVHAETQKGYDHFFKHHTPVEWDMDDI